MTKNRLTKVLLCCIFVITSMNFAMSQEPADTALTLEERFTEIIQKSETYKDKKIVRRSQLNLFWASLSDTLATNQADLKAALASKMDMQEQLKQSQDSLRQAQLQLQSSLGENSKTSFLGLRIDQSLYNILTWGIVILLAALCVWFFQRFKTGHAIVTETKQEYEQVKGDYDRLRHKAKETEMKLKRELQTALNRLEMVDNR